MIENKKNAVFRDNKELAEDIFEAISTHKKQDRDEAIENI